MLRRYVHISIAAMNDRRLFTIYDLIKLSNQEIIQASLLFQESISLGSMRALDDHLSDPIILCTSQTSWIETSKWNSYFHDKSEENNKTSGKNRPWCQKNLSTPRITYNPKPRKNIKRETQEKYFTTQPKEILTQRIKHKF